MILWNVLNLTHIVWPQKMTIIFHFHPPHPRCNVYILCNDHYKIHNVKIELQLCSEYFHLNSEITASPKSIRHVSCQLKQHNHEYITEKNEPKNLSAVLFIIRQNNRMKQQFPRVFGIVYHFMACFTILIWWWCILWLFKIS